MIQKTKVLTLIILGSLFMNLSAQEGSFEDDPVVNTSESNKKFRLGLRFDPSIAWMSTNSANYENEGSKFGYSYGLSTEFFLNGTQNYLFSTGLMISSLGGEISYTGTYVDDNYDNVSTKILQSYDIGYIELPVALKLRTNQIGYMNFYGLFGLKLGIKYKAKSDYTYEKAPEHRNKAEDINTISDIFFMNTSLVVGAGVEYNVSGNTNIMLGVTYNNGFINQLRTDVNEINSDGDALLNDVGEPVYSSKKASANVNYFALNIGVYF